MIAICHKEFAIGEEIELQLMRRERDSLLPMPAALFSQEIACETPRISHPTAATPYAKLLIASKEEVQFLRVSSDISFLHIIFRKFILYFSLFFSYQLASSLLSEEVSLRGNQIESVVFLTYLPILEN